MTFLCCCGICKNRQRFGRTARLLVSSSCTAAAHFIGATWAEVSSQPVPQLPLPWLAWCYGASTGARRHIYVLSLRRLHAVVEFAKFGRGLVALHACWSAALAQLLPISSVPHGQKCLVNQCPSCACLGWPGVTVLQQGLETTSMCCLDDVFNLWWNLQKSSEVWSHCTLVGPQLLHSCCPFHRCHMGRSV